MLGPPKNRFSCKEYFSELNANYDYLFSSEWLCAMDFDSILKINNYIINHKPVYIVTYRNFSEHVASSYLQALKYGPDILLSEKWISGHIQTIKKSVGLLRKLHDSGIELICLRHGRDLIEKFDRVLFSRSVSQYPAFSSVNSSPDTHQAALIRLTAKLGIRDYKENLKYIEKFRDLESPFTLSLVQHERIQSSLLDEIDVLNSITDNQNKYIENYKVLEQRGALIDEINE